MTFLKPWGNCYKFHVYSFHFWWEMSKLQLVWLEVEDEFFRVHFILYIYCFAYINRRIATPVVEARSCNLWDLGSIPSGTLLQFSCCFCNSGLFCLAGAGPFGSGSFLFLLADSHTDFWHPLAQIILFIHLFHFFSFLKNIF